MTDEYSQDTLKVAQVIQKYAAVDPFNPERPGLVKVRQMQHYQS